MTTRTRATETHRNRRGKVLLLDPFTGESLDVLWEDWLPTLELAALWNGWSDKKLLQLEGYLQGKALQEWSLLSEGQKTTFAAATWSLHSKLDPAGQIVAAQDFRHVV